MVRLGNELGLPISHFFKKNFFVAGVLVFILKIF